MFVSPGLECSVAPALSFFKRNSFAFRSLPQTNLEVLLARICSPPIQLRVPAKPVRKRTGTEHDLSETREVLPDARPYPIPNYVHFS